VAVVMAASSMGTLSTEALFTDQVAMAQVSVTGGTLDIQANGANGSAVAYNGTGATITTNVSNMKPGDTAWGEVTISNAGSLPATIKVTSSGSDTHPSYATHCFSYFFRQTSATGATKDATFPVTLASMGSAETPDTSTVLFETSVAGRDIYDVDGSDLVWETDDTKTFRLTVRMRSECEQGGNATSASAGTLNFTFNAVQT